MKLRIEEIEMDNRKTEYILSLSYGKDSLACLGAIEKLGLPLTRIITADVWATDDIPADLPPVVEFKSKADMIIKERYGIEVDHFCVEKNGEKWTFEKEFYHIPRRRTTNVKLPQGSITGFPGVEMPTCNSALKRPVFDKINRICGFDCVQYIGIAADESERIKRFENRHDKAMPLVLAGWTETDCRKWCEDNGLLSPTYETISRSGCWFCHLQSVDTLRQLRHNYPDLWALLLKWDNDSPRTFKANHHTVHDYDRRFDAEDREILIPGLRFRWDMLDVLRL